MSTHRKIQPRLDHRDSFNSTPPLPTHSALLAGLAALLLTALFLSALPALAHEVIVTVTSSDSYHVNVGGAAHLQHDPVDFGDDLVGTSTTRTVTVSNIHRRAVQVIPSPPANMVVSPTVLDLAAAGEAGDAGVLTLTYERTAEGSFAEELELAVSHDGVANPKAEAIDYTVVALTPPRLEISVPELGLSDISSVDLGYLSNRHYEPHEHPSFELVVTNTGGMTAELVKLNFQELLFTHPSPWGYGDCSSNELMNLCVIGENDLDVHHLGDLAPGESVSTTWTLVPYDSGSYHPTLRFLTADPHIYADIEIIVDIIPFTLPEKRLYQDLTEASTHMGTVESPFGDDPLVQLRPKGFDSRTVFDLGEFDSVDLRAGNLTFIVPIGEAIQARGPLSYSLQAVYNSDLWYRQTLDEIELSDPTLPGRIQPVSGEWPDIVHNLVGGWSFHLGRLLPPNDFDGLDVENLCTGSSPPDYALDHELEAHTGKHFIYVDSYGTSREFWAKPHGEEPYNSGDPDWDALSARQYTFTRDGSYLRMWKENENVRWVEEPGGIRRRFQKLGRNHTDTLNDEWLLTRIQDHHGNRVNITYGDSTWTLKDSASWREVKVFFQDWNGRRVSEANPSLAQPLIVDRVELPGFDGGAAREYDFQYHFKTIHRPARSSFHQSALTNCLDDRVTLPLISRINAPDGTHWAFDYQHRALSNSENDDDSRMVKATLPTKGTVHYQYANRIFDTGNNCTSAGDDVRGHGGVKRRYVMDGTIRLEDTRYLREIRRTADIPFGYCEVQGSSSSARPWSQQRVAIWKDLGEPPEGASFGIAPPKSTVKLHHFNIWPYSDQCSSSFPGLCSNQGGRWVLNSGRSHIERNLMIDLSEASGDLNRSTETFECSTRPSSVDWNGLSGESSGSPNPSAGDEIQDALSGCGKVEETWARFEVSLSGNCTQASSPNCLRDSRMLKEKTVFREHTGSEHHRQLVNSDYDGLGHYRRQNVSTSSISTWGNDGLSKPLARTTFRDYNPGVGTLQLDANHRVTSNINLPSTWLLETYGRFWTKEGSTYRGGDACFDGSTGALKGSRSWRCASGDNYNCSGAEGALSSVRTWQDVVTLRTINTFGEVEKQRFYGGDGGTGVAPSANLCTVDPADGNADYIVDHAYEFGRVKTKQVRGASTFEMRREIDRATGWPLEQTLNSGEKLTFAYDGIGRRTRVLSNRAASSDFYFYTDAGTHKRRMQARTFGLGGISGPLIRTYVAEYDGLGRLKKEILPKAGGGTVDRNITYDAGGRVRTVGSVEGGYSAYSYDYRGKPMVVRFPDQTRKEYLHYGDRWSREFNCVGVTGASQASGVCRNSLGEVVETGTFMDFFGRTRRVLVKGAGGTWTDFVYDPADQMRSATRSATGGGVSQTRSWLYDGLGFLLQESIPEQNQTTFSGHDTRGNAGLVHIGGRYLGYSHDELGRLTSVSSDGEILKSFFYHDSGGGNGQLEKGIRRAHHEGLYTAGGPGIFETVSVFGYDSAGRRNSRSTHVDFLPAGGGTTQRMGHFDQSWEYDPVGNVKKLGYPTCRTGNHCTDDDLTVNHSYSQGFYRTGVDVVGSSTLGADLTYHPSGLVHQVTHQGGGGTDIYGIAGGRLRIANMHLASGTSSALNLGAVTYDGSGNIRTIGSESFDYDRHSRLTAATVRAPGGTTASYNYSYDVFDNRTNPYPSDTSTNRALIPGVQWDAFGNMSVAGATTAVYDPFDKLLAINVPPPPSDPPLPITRQISIYDHDDLRVLRWDKLEFVPVGTTQEDPVWTLRDGLRVIREIEGSGPEARTAVDFIYAGTRLISSRRYSGTSYGSGDERHYHADQVGNNRLITGHDGKEIFFRPFGSPIDSAFTSGERTVGFQGHETDGALTYMRGRHYYPGLGRFIQVDPGRDRAAWSLYSFGANNPISADDPDGHTSRKKTEWEIGKWLVWIFKGDTHHGDRHFHFAPKRGGPEGRFYANGRGVTTKGKTTNPPTKLLKKMEKKGLLQHASKATKVVKLGYVWGLLQADDIEAGDQYTQEEEDAHFREHVERVKAEARERAASGEGDEEEEEENAEEKEDGTRPLTDDMARFLARY